MSKNEGKRPARQIVGVGEMKVSAREEDTLITHALGSCLGITLHDPIARVGGLLHMMLPDSSIDPPKAASRPCLFADTGIRSLLKACCAAGADRRRLVAKVAGGAEPSIRGQDWFEQFQIGKRNIAAIKQLFDEGRIRLSAHDLGGKEPRTMSIVIGTGEVTLRMNGKERRL